MENILPFAALGLLALACPLMMVAMGVGAWVIARARGQTKDLSMGCMPMSGHGEQPARSEESGLREQVERLQQEVQALKSQTKAQPGANGAEDAAVAPTAEEHRV